MCWGAFAVALRNSSTMTVTFVGQIALALSTFVKGSPVKITCYLAIHRPKPLNFEDKIICNFEGQVIDVA